METKRTNFRSGNENNDESSFEDVHLRDYLQIAWRRRWIVLIPIVMSLLFAAYYVTVSVKTFQAQAIIELLPEFEKSGSDYSAYSGTEQTRLKSFAFIESVIHKLNLDQDKRYASSRNLFDEVWQAVAADIEVSTIRATRMISIKAQHPNPKTAADIANALVETIPQHKIRVFEMARVPLHPVKSKKAVASSVIIFGLVMGFFLVFWLEYLEDTVKTQAHVEIYLQLPHLGSIPHLQTPGSAETYLYSHAHRNSLVAENYREVRDLISFFNRPQVPQVLSVTSGANAEGKSVLASNLAIVTAQLCVSTLLIEMDLRHPSLQKMYQVPDRFGLARYLTGEAKDLRDVVQKTVVANLDLLPCGATDSDPSDLIASERLKSLLVAARASYNRIIMDCPAMSAVGESLTLSAMADCTVFLIPVNRVRRRFALRFVRKLQAGGINVTGVVLNDVD